MDPIPSEELNLAKRMVLWFAEGSGEDYIAQLAEFHGLDEEALRSWAKSMGYLFRDDIIDLDILPIIWRAFASKSRVCLALHTARHELNADNRVSQWLRRSALKEKRALTTI